VRVQRFDAHITGGRHGHGVIEVPFDPDEAWGVKTTHQVNGTINGKWVRGTIAPGSDGWTLTVTPMWMRDTGLAADQDAIVELAPEAPQRCDLAEDISAALAANPAAAAGIKQRPSR
jgi:hypothetical protein